MTRLHIDIVGEGPDLVLLHGWAMHGGIWGSVRDRLSQQFRLHLVDLPGHGLSSACEPTTLSRLAEIITGILPERCMVGGWSLGGQIAMELALRESERIEKLILISTTPCFAKRDDWESGMDPKLLQLFWENLKLNYATTINRFLTLQMSGDRDASKVLLQLRQHFFQRAEPEPAALEKSLQILQQSDLRDRIAAIRQPVLIMHGDNDVITHPDAADWMHRQLPHARFVRFAHCGHAPFLSYPDQFVTCLNEFRTSS
ncbi:pimeloyl-[acyl-carrier protein] methyl ester esterase [Nitrosomonas sp. JL21]|uniref:pimeloyl-ACP methyl ester esterase BioH n=1 Tax=Nitrosomonas sp. JL21 TaxID=153949 RepID=UPI00137177A8|nr:pimeloyl-ACP methyl ester esterase BioH [Nitrosomonas sp. JL21]MBL8498260.1 pimeloyl-ACP methyl ester esterase BioH [Nitrosomonas sp.]MCC7091994.1 pimeloyl-ACP methyl ester esterase BioH [Nitrosomonas sp.]MXS77708.1 pimeloyl-[acyl-carrier protein] methyl ester esterase [Nitrosomonas sp. JL21]